jgi:hypothetical protein
VYQSWAQRHVPITSETWKAEAGGPKVWSQPGYTAKPCLKGWKRGSAVQRSSSLHKAGDLISSTANSNKGIPKETASFNFNFTATKHQELIRNGRDSPVVECLLASGKPSSNPSTKKQKQVGILKCLDSEDADFRVFAHT